VERIIRLAAEVDAVVLGPGLTTHAEAVSVVQRLVELLPSPLVLDADGLNAFAETGPGAIMARSAPTVITPHPGELARLLGVSTLEVQGDRVSAAARVAGCQLACVLKGARTIVSAGGSARSCTRGRATLPQTISRKSVSPRRICPRMCLQRSGRFSASAGRGFLG
jgi:NAD(P)H-hydrate epimerase